MDTPTPNTPSTALITGAAGDIGLACADLLLTDGFRVALTDADPEALTTPDVEAGSSSRTYELDVTDETRVSTIFSRAEAELGPVSVLVCCAGIMLGDRSGPVAIADMELSDWQRTFDVNAAGTFLCAREMLRRRRANPIVGSRIITISSAAAQLGGYRGDAAYVASKAALLGFTKIAARQAADIGMTVNCVAAGPVRSAMFEQKMLPEAVPGLTGKIPLGRIGSPRDVAEAVRFLAGRQSDWITGATLDVNGGYRMQ